MPLASAECECGYTLNYDHEKPVFFTDLLESNFEKMATVDIGANTDWNRQEYNITAEKSSGPYGKIMDVRNVELIPSSEFEPQKRVLKLVVDSVIVDGMVSNAEMASNRNDIMHGTFSVSMKTTDIPGTCQAFFWVA